MGVHVWHGRAHARPSVRLLVPCAGEDGAYLQHVPIAGDLWIHGFLEQHLQLAAHVRHDR